MGDCWIALLRGINVGTAKRIAMADLRATVQSLGYQDVATLLNSGNVVFRQPQGAKAPPAPAIEQAVAKRLGVSATVIAMPVTTLDAILRTNPLEIDCPGLDLAALGCNRSNGSSAPSVGPSSDRY
jgi:uncharacterized protein (DUF1697 family)